MKNVTFRALSPDGFDCFMDEAYDNRVEAAAAIRRFAARYEKQGYYSGMTGRIHFAKIVENCTISGQYPKIPKCYNEMFNVGKAKYVVNYHDGEDTHPDGSPFFGIAIFKNKKDKAKYIKTLLDQGYKYGGL